MPSSKILALGFAVALSVLAPACGYEEPAEELAASDDSLNATSYTLWPTRDGVAPIHVCWSAPALATQYPNAQLTPNLAAVLAVQKQWVREIAERQWNALTPVKFVGWNECSAGGGDVAITLTDSAFTAPCAGYAGQSCASGLGTMNRGKDLYINVLFGEEARFLSRYMEYVSSSLEDPVVARFGWTPPGLCDEMIRPWSTRAPQNPFPVNIDAPANRARFETAYKRCVQNISLHELGHVAGFAHEQYRKDDPAGQQECASIIKARGFMDYENVTGTPAGDTPLGPFDRESIMSYCRSNPAPTLTAGDVRFTREVYSGRRY